MLLHTEAFTHRSLDAQMLLHTHTLELCSSQPARDWKSCFFYFFIFFHFDHHFFGLKIIISFLSPLSFFIIFSFLFFLPLAFSFFFPLLRKWSLVLGNCHQRLFLEPFSSVFRLLCALAIFLSYAFKIDLRNCQKELFLEPFSFFSHVGNFSFLCL